MAWTPFYETVFLPWTEPTTINLANYQVPSQELATVLASIAGLSSTPALHLIVRVLVALGCYTPKPDDAPVVEAHVLTRDGKELAALPVPAPERGSVLFELPVGSLGQGTYILRIRATLGAEQAEDMTAIVIAR
jgi:hypothetical protein